jgi:hypothetical protein
MPSLNFPDQPGIGTVFFTGEHYYRWNGTVWKSYYEGSSQDIKRLDDISHMFNGVRQTFPLTVNASSALPGQPEKYMIILGGIQQAPHTDYTTSIEGSAEITFQIPPNEILTFHGVSLSGTSPNSATQLLNGAVTPPKISTGGPSWSGVGTVYAIEFSGGGSRLSGITSTLNAGVQVVAQNTQVGVVTQLNFVSPEFKASFNSNALGDATAEITIKMPEGINITSFLFQ